jgi:hypothetical protein
MVGVRSSYSIGLSMPSAECLCCRFRDRAPSHNKNPWSASGFQRIRASRKRGRGAQEVAVGTKVEARERTIITLMVRLGPER